MNPEKVLWNASKVFAPTFPRWCADDGSTQARRTSRSDFVAALGRASSRGSPGYYSVYAFPDGHPQWGNIPRVDCIFIDLDVTGDMYDPDSPSMHDWRYDMSALLARARMIADAICDADQEQHFRAVLSGHKGIHLYLDFPPIAPENGTQGQFKNGLALYGETVMDWLDGLAGGVNIHPWVDVDASDLSRLGRHPNTRHHGASHDEVDRWCVPVTMAELATLTTDDYLSLTSQPRPLPDGYERVPSQTAHDKLVQRIRSAADSSRGSTGDTRRTREEEEALRDYRTSQNECIELDDLLDPVIMGDKPCVQAFRKRDDAYRHGIASRKMELSIMGRFLDMNVPVEVIHEFFEPIPGYDEQTTNDMLADLLARDNPYGEFNCATICGGVDRDGKRVAAQAPQFCLRENCSIYRRSDDLR